MASQTMRPCISWYAARNISLHVHNHVTSKHLRTCTIAYFCTRGKITNTNCMHVVWCGIVTRPFRQNYSEQILYRRFCQHAGPAVMQNRETEAWDDEQLENLAQRMKESASEMDKMALSIPSRSLTKSVRTLISNGFSVDDCLSFAKDSNIVKHLPGFTTVYTELLQYGFLNEDIIEMIRKCPKLLTLKKAMLLSQVESLRKLGLTQSPIEVIIKKMPQILLEDIKSVNSSYQILKGYFKTEEVNEICTRAPELLFADPKEIDQKISYAKSEMYVSNRSLINSGYFSHTMEHIKTRHIFLIRADFFKLIKKSKGQVNTNPLLRDIVDTTDEEFAKMFGNMTAKDYQTFKKLLKKETEWQEDDLD